METREQIGKWYDDFSEHQEKTSVNLRHYMIMEFLVRAGLKKDSKVLEIGCGIGTLTGLIAKYVKRGEIVAADISPESVSMARKRLSRNRKVDFLVTDMTDFSHPGTFDFIVLPDVLEHIPLEQHRALFSTLADHMHEKSVILIHIPHPRALDYLRERSPDQLQIIDQSVEADILTGNAYAAGLELVNYLSYKLFDRKHDYALITLRKKNAVIPFPLPQSQIIVRKLLSRIRFMISRL
ncbi:MAG: class I SAM-dependent methyltransferase [Bacteroidales bacterium]|nr:class I SAM-dependent methyltransferase [Bacteroidales bacterium]MDT8372848.1 class I SAM-dependent methyltransferase [Bacteroidales bacterium]